MRSDPSFTYTRYTDAEREVSNRFCTQRACHVNHTLTATAAYPWPTIAPVGDPAPARTRQNKETIHGAESFQAALKKQERTRHLSAKSNKKQQSICVQDFPPASRTPPHPVGSSAIHHFLICCCSHLVLCCCHRCRSVATFIALHRAQTTTRRDGKINTK